MMRSGRKSIIYSVLNSFKTFFNFSYILHLHYKILATIFTINLDYSTKYFNLLIKF